MRKQAIFVAATALLVSAITIAVAAPEAVEKPAAGEFGSPMAKAHPDEARAMLAAAQKAWQANKASYDVGQHRWRTFIFGRVSCCWPSARWPKTKTKTWRP